MHMSVMKIVFLASMGLGLLGCVSQQSHGTLEELETASQRSAQEIEQLHHMVKEKQEAVMRLETQKKDLEATIEVQDQIKEQQLEAIKKELESLYGQVAGVEQKPEDGSATQKAVFSDDPINFEDLMHAFQNLQSLLPSQMADFSKLRDQNDQLEQEISAMEARLQDVERLKRELEQVRLAREIQENQLAKVKREVQTVSEEIDRITKALENKFGQSLVVTQHQDRLVLTLLGQVLFESGEAELTPLGLEIMKQVGQVLTTLPEKYIQVEGHTDDNPIYGKLQHQYPTNWELSTARATTVLRYLIEQTKMSPQDFGATGYADTRPVTTNDTEEGRAQNRRVEIVLYPKQPILVKDTVATIAQ
jgi:chemotaxis protein MotB